jgi:hypothetical protein
MGPLPFTDGMPTILQRLSKEDLVMPPMIIAARPPRGYHVAISIRRGRFSSQGEAATFSA